MDPTLVLLLTRVARLNEAFFQQACGDAGTTPAEFRVLALLRHRVGDEPVSPATISEWIVQTSGGLTATLRRLEDAGWIDRIRDPNDGRSQHIDLTAAGRGFHDDLFAVQLERYETVLGDIDQQRALAVVQEIVQRFESAQDQPPSAGWRVETEVTS